MAFHKRKNEIKYFDYKDFKTLQRYITPMGEIEARGKTGLREKQQKQLAQAIKKARHLALLPFVTR
jgi:small subunit ribosomal protein S18